MGLISGDLLTSRSAVKHTACAAVGAYRGAAAGRRRQRARRGQAAGYFAAFFLRSAQEAFIRSDTASFSLAVIGRRFLVGLASDAVSGTGVATAAGRREEERGAAGFAGAEVPSIWSTSFNVLISACRRSISLCRSAIASAIAFMGFPGGCIVSRSMRPARPSASMGSDSNPTRARRPDGARFPSEEAPGRPPSSSAWSNSRRVPGAASRRRAGRMAAERRLRGDH